MTKTGDIVIIYTACLGKYSKVCVPRANEKQQIDKAFLDTSLHHAAAGASMQTSDTKQRSPDPTKTQFLQFPRPFWHSGVNSSGAVLRDTERGLCANHLCTCNALKPAKPTFLVDTDKTANAHVPFIRARENIHAVPGRKICVRRCVSLQSLFSHLDLIDQRE